MNCKSARVGHNFTVLSIECHYILVKTDLSLSRVKDDNRHSGKKTLNKLKFQTD